jgi:N6-adenosine-specific RNA methylase IME4
LRLEDSPPQKYRTIVADPPWRYSNATPITGKADRRAGASAFYPTMTDGEIAALPVADLADDNAHLYLWVTNPRMFECDPVGIARSWGFTYKTLLTWYKTGPTGLGYYFRGRTKHVLFCVRGQGLPIHPSQREQNIVLATNRDHSTKPDAFYDLVERVSPEPRLEMFARRQRLGWDTWGNEALEHVRIAT